MQSGSRATSRHRDQASRLHLWYTVVLNMIRFPDHVLLQFRTGSGLDWYLKKLNRIRYGYPNCITTTV